MAAAWNMVAVPITFSRRRPWRARCHTITAPPNITPAPKPIRASRGPSRAPIAPIIFTSPPPIPPIANGQRSTPTVIPRPARLSSRPAVPRKAVLSVIPRSMVEPEIAFGIRRVRTSAITQSATKMTTVATVRDCINSLHFSVQRRPDVRGAAVRPPLSRFHPTHGRARFRRQLRRCRSRSEPCSRACRHPGRSRSPPQRRSCRSPPERCRTRPGPGLRHRQPISSLALSCSPPFRGPAPSSLLGLATFRPVPAHTTENPSPTSRLGRCRGGVDHVLSPTPQRADIAGDDDGYDNRDDADGRQGNPVLREILGGFLVKQPLEKLPHDSPSYRALGRPEFNPSKSS